MLLIVYSGSTSEHPCSNISMPSSVSVKTASFFLILVCTRKFCGGPKSDSVPRSSSKRIASTPSVFFVWFIETTCSLIELRVWTMLSTTEGLFFVLITHRFHRSPIPIGFRQRWRRSMIDEVPFATDGFHPIAGPNLPTGTAEEFLGKGIQISGKMLRDGFGECLLGYGKIIAIMFVEISRGWRVVKRGERRWFIGCWRSGALWMHFLPDLYIREEFHWSDDFYAILIDIENIVFRVIDPEKWTFDVTSFSCEQDEPIGGIALGVSQLDEVCLIQVLLLRNRSNQGEFHIFQLEKNTNSSRTSAREALSLTFPRLFLFSMKNVSIPSFVIAASLLVVESSTFISVCPFSSISSICRRVPLSRNCRLIVFILIS